MDTYSPPSLYPPNPPSTRSPCLTATLLTWPQLVGALRHHGDIPWDDGLDFLVLDAALPTLQAEAPRSLRNLGLILLGFGSPAHDTHITRSSCHAHWLIGMMCERGKSFPMG